MHHRIPRFALLILGIAGLTSSMFAQEFNFPESIAYNPQTGSYLVTNFSGNCVIEFDAEHEKTCFLEDVPSPLGALEEKGILYFVTGNKSIKGFALSGAIEVFSVTIPDAVFLNDLTSDGSGSLFATDTGTGVIYRLRLLDQSFEPICETGFQGLNGILYDEASHRLVFCAFNSEGQIGQLDLATNTFSTIPLVLGENLDGITSDGTAFYFSSWGPGSFQEGFQEGGGKIYQVDRAFQTSRKLECQGLDGPADIYYLPEKDVLVVPDALRNTVTFLPLEASSKETESARD